MRVLGTQPDSTTLLVFMSDLDKSIYAFSITQVSEVISTLLREMGRRNMLAPVSEVLRLYDLRIEQATSEGEIEASTSEKLERLYIPVIRSIRWFHRQSTLVPNTDKGLHRYTDQLLVRLVDSLVQQIESLPTTSTSPTPTLSPEILRLLFRKPFLRPELKKYLLRYNTTRKVTMSSGMWWGCFLSAVDEGDIKAAKRFRKLAGQRAKVEPEPCGSKADGIRQQEYQTTMDPKITGDVTYARTSRRVQDVLDLVGSNLYSTTPQTSHAWSHLLNTTRKDTSVDTSTLASLRDSIPPESINSYTLTPLMLSCLEKGDAGQAWQIWRDLVDRQSAGVDVDGGVYVDRVALAVSTLVAYHLSDLDASIKLLDSWAKRPTTSTSTTTFSPSPSTLASATRSNYNRKHSKSNLNQSIILDTQNLNVILEMCLRERRPSVALRLFTAALPRWGVYTDDISLTLLLETCRFHNPNSRNRGSRHGNGNDNGNRDGGYDIPDIRDRLRQLTDSIRFGRSESSRPTSSSTSSGTRGEGYEAYDAAGFAKGSISVILDPPGYVWRKEHSEPAWRMARDIFRDVLFTNWPFLINIPSVLDFDRGPYASQARDLSSIFRFTKSTSPASPTSRLRIPSPDSRRPYLHLVPSANTFHSAIALLGYHNLPDEIPLVLAWMKELDIKPTKKTMLLALTHLGEVEGPRRVLANWENGQSRLVRDTEVLRRWLIDWVGRGVPTENDVADHRRQMLENNVRLSA